MDAKTLQAIKKNTPSMEDVKMYGYDKSFIGDLYEIIHQLIAEVETIPSLVSEIESLHSHQATQNQLILEMAKIIIEHRIGSEEKRAEFRRIAEKIERL